MPGSATAVVTLTSWQQAALTLLPPASAAPVTSSSNHELPGRRQAGRWRRVGFQVIPHPSLSRRATLGPGSASRQRRPFRLIVTDRH